MVHRRNAAAILLLLLAAGGLAGSCSPDDPVEVAVILPLSGPWSVYGHPILEGVELAHEQVQRRGDLPWRLTLEVADSESDPDRAAELLKQMYRRGALVALGGVTSAEALAMVPVADEEERVLLSPSASSSELSGRSRYFFRVFPSDVREGTKMANYAATELNLKEVVILAADSTYARGISEVFQAEFERNRGEVSALITYPEGTEDLSDFVRQALREDPVAVYVADFAGPALEILSRLKRGGFRGKLMTTSAFAAPEVLAAAGQAAEDVLLTQTAFDPDSEEPEVQAFVQAYRERYGETPGTFAAHAYDALMTLADALRGMSVRAASEYLKGIRSLGSDYSGVTGAIAFDEKGDVGQFPRVYIYQDGEFEDYQRVREEMRRELIERLERIRRERERRLRQQGGAGD